MENLSLGELKYILQEPIYLFEEDQSELKNKVSENKSELVKKNEVPPTPHEEPIKSDELKPETEEIEIEPIKVRGKFEKGILILHEEAALSDPVMDMLVKMIQAVGHSMSEVGLVSSEELHGKSLEEFQAINAHIVLKFGKIKHPINALPIHEYQIHTEEETEYLFADSLTAISEDKNLKVKTWNALKLLFNISK
ncbi:hypothetical protein SAMN04488519_102291 [Algoriphagus ornithinivorans]|uniref:Uncharacterized protein n=1 Tax=Algoriphagus ornithinivorans TaxID=226506 RepID=A0A1I5CJ74_9BACT|nr:hypothetical protein [Algoriphagus ornithinivorans]SFN86944.1 hypothetical protein SAMN04488519_102291 [Algoriphagus ornithinivorans]